MTLACGIDVGGTKIAGGVVDEDGRILAERKVVSPATDVGAMETAIADLIADLGDRHEIGAVGIGAAGYVDASRTRVMIAPNIAWRDVDLAHDVSERVGLPVVVENDANAAAWGEFAYGAGHDVDHLLQVTVGTGVGGGIVHDGVLFRGAFGVAAEIGHLRVERGGRLCGCGNHGCFEQYASGSALVRNAREIAASGAQRAETLLERVGCSVEGITGPAITAAARDGDLFATEQLAEIGRWLGEGLASLVNVLDPAVIVVGGGVADAGELLLEPIRTAFAGNLTGYGDRPTAEIRPAELGNRAGIIGAADLARKSG